MPEAALLELEYAALMHDIGQLSLRDPVPGGATVLVAREEQRRIAEYGAEVIEQARVLDTVADIVRRQSDPCRPADRGQQPPLSQPHHPRRQRLRRPGGQLGRAQPGRRRRCERLRLDTAVRVRPAGGRGAEQAGEQAVGARPVTSVP